MFADSFWPLRQVLSLILCAAAATVKIAVRESKKLQDSEVVIYV